MFATCRPRGTREQPVVMSQLHEVEEKLIGEWVTDIIVGYGHTVRERHNQILPTRLNRLNDVIIGFRHLFQPAFLLGGQQPSGINSCQNHVSFFVFDPWTIANVHRVASVTCVRRVLFTLTAAIKGSNVPELNRMFASILISPSMPFSFQRKEMSRFLDRHSFPRVAKWPIISSHQRLFFFYFSPFFLLSYFSS